MYGIQRELKIKTGQAQVGLPHRGLRTKNGRLEVFLKFKFSLARALTSDTSLELAALIPHFVPPYKIINF